MADDAQTPDKLGKYKCPGKAKAGMDSFKGSSKGGCQDEFYLACIAYMKAVNNASPDNAKIIPSQLVRGSDGSLKFGTGGDILGFLTVDEANRLVESGGSSWIRPSSNRHFCYFGYGLGMLVYTFDGTATGSVDAGDYGIELVSLAGGQTYLRPADVEFSPDNESVSYEGDAYRSDDDAAGSASASASASTGAASPASSGASVASSMFFLSNAFRDIGDVSSAYMLTGDRALANDVPVSTTVFNLCKASMRSYIAGPYGNFIAFFPDYWGVYGNGEPAVVVDDIELLDVSVTMSDDEFYSHVYIPSVSLDGSAFGGSGAANLMMTSGVVSIESGVEADYDAVNDGVNAVSDQPSPILKKLVNFDDDDAWMYSPRELYRRYGARPSVSQQSITAGVQAVQTDVAGATDGDGDMTQGQAMVYLLALYEFMYHWANQCQVSISTTFMPMVFPGERMKIPLKDGRHVTVYVKGVTHSMSYESGFTTKITACCPTGDLYPGMVRDFGDNGGEV